MTDVSALPAPLVPVAAGGMSVLGNLITACAACNTSKHAKSLDEWEGA